MGLDQYLQAVMRPAPELPADLTATGGYWANWGHYSPEERATYQRVLEFAGLSAFAREDTSAYLEEREWVDEAGEWHTDPPSGLIVTVAQWRKANAVHAWFVREVQDGVDDCGNYPVHLEQLAHLRSICMDALAAFDAGEFEQVLKLLPPSDGFFFGGTELDDWYRWSNLENTIEQLEHVIATAVAIPGEVALEYASSW